MIYDVRLRKGGFLDAGMGTDVPFHESLRLAK